MLKLPKGLKKKKNKKSKKNQELFTEEELEQFKREQRAKQLAEQEQAEQQEREEEEQRQQQQQQHQHQHYQQQQTASTSKPKTDDDEWSKFTQLTSGIDSILKKTQGDLNRIKEQSFFQKVEPPKPPVKSPEPEEKVAEQEPEPELTEEELFEQRKLAALKAAVVELSDSESESEEADDIFDTNYIDELASGNLPLAYVPESPVEEDLGPDPFDTNFADKVIKGPEVSKRGKKIVHIGAAVEVLTGRVDNVALRKDALRRPRRGPQNLLLSSFDQDKEAAEEVFGIVDTVAKEEPGHAQPVLSLLDDPSDIVADVPIDLSTSLHLDFYKKKQEEEREAERLRRELEKDEFDELAEESLTKKADVIVVDPTAIAIEPVPVEPGNWKSEFEEQAELGIVDIYDDDLEEEVEVDPFDTCFVATVVREKSIDDDDFDPRAGEEPVKRDSIVQVQPTQPTLTVQQKDLLSGSTSDLTDLSHVPVIQASESIELEIDPFDTSAISALVQPKETEIKFLEKELLSDVGLKHSLSDPDFDPRSDEPPVHQSQSQPQVVLSTAERKSSLSLNIVQTKTVGFDVSGGLTVNNNGDHKKKPVTPYYSDKTIKDESDISDSDFDPRAVTPHDNKNPNQDLLSVGETNIDSKVLTPATGASASEDTDDFAAVEDPFDTSNASALLLPGKAELKLIENELIETVQSTEVTNVLDINSDSQELGLGGKVLTPQITLPVEDSFDDIDPFDTTFASNIAPGQAEIKILESELIHK